MSWIVSFALKDTSNATWSAFSLLLYIDAAVLSRINHLALVSFVISYADLPTSMQRTSIRPSKLFCQYSRACRLPPFSSFSFKFFHSAAPEINTSPVSDIVSGSRNFVPVFCIWYTIEIWKPAGHCDRQKRNPVSHTWNRVGQWPVNGGYFMRCVYDKSC